MSLIQQLHRANQISADIYRACNTSTLTITQHFILATVADHPGSSQAELTELTDIDRSTMADVVRRLLTLEYVSRTDDKKDARAYLVSITPKGQTQLKKARNAIEATEKHLLERVPMTARSGFVKGMDALSVTSETRQAAE